MTDLLLMVLLSDIDQQPILFSDVAGVPGAKVPLNACNC